MAYDKNSSTVSTAAMEELARRRAADKTAAQATLKAQAAPMTASTAPAAAPTPAAPKGIVRSMGARAGGIAARSAMPLAVLAEGAGVAGTAADPNATGLDVGAQAAGSVGRLAAAQAGATKGAALGARAGGPYARFTGPLGGVVGGIGGYLGADKAIEAGAGMLSPASAQPALPSDADMIPTDANPNPPQRTPQTAQQLRAGIPRQLGAGVANAQTVPLAATGVPQAQSGAEAVQAAPAPVDQSQSAPGNTINVRRQANGVPEFSGTNITGDAQYAGDRGIISRMAGKGGVSTIEGGSGGRSTAEINAAASRVLGEMSAINDKYHQDFGRGARRQPSPAEKKAAQDSAQGAAELGIRAAAARSDEQLKQGQIAAMNQLQALGRQIDAADPGSAEQKALLAKYQVLSGKQPAQSKVVLEDFNTGEVDAMGQPVWRKRAINAETGQPITTAQEKTMPQVATQAEFDKLPKGATYIGPDGKTYRK